ncbi:MAG: o-succinylbenzoate synthase [Flavobacteriales bacterium]|nr:o-succinylbenzoate synthase [Flavobacteriales bacterium]
MSVTASYIKHTLHFKVPSGTSRGILYDKDTWFLVLKKGELTSIGECGMFKGLSCDDVPNYEKIISNVCKAINAGENVPDLTAFPSINFGLEIAQGNLSAMEKGETFLESPFTRGQMSIPINGLVWMGSKEQMLRQIHEKIELGFQCIKLKIGAINFDDELSLIKHIRSQYSEKEITIRVDANGAFAFKDAMERLKRLSDYSLHSIEQPIRAGEWEKMSSLCANTPLPIALDEELIGVNDPKRLLNEIKPQYIILKPTLLGGLSKTKKWMNYADEMNIGYWVTSALESNVGLDAIARFTAKNRIETPQGLGTGGLFTNNVPYPFEIKNGFFHLSENFPSGEEILRFLTTYQKNTIEI